MMGHLNNSQLLQLAKKTYECIPYDDVEDNWLEHLKTCKECFDSFKAALVVSEFMSEEGGVYLSRVLHETAEEKASIKEKVIGAIKCVYREISESVSAVFEQLDRATSIFCFEPALTGARGVGDEPAQSIRSDDMYNEGTYMVFDLKSRQLIVELRQEDYPPEKIDVYIETVVGKLINIPLESNGITLTGRSESVPDGDFTVKIVLRD